MTILVGENSAGKTTFLALCQIASAILEGYSPTISFNESPFSLGAFEQIGSYVGGRAGRVREFSIGVELAFEDSENAVVHAIFGSEAGQPAMKSWRFESGPRKMLVERADDGDIKVQFWRNSKSAEVNVPKAATDFGIGPFVVMAAHFVSSQSDAKKNFVREELGGSGRTAAFNSAGFRLFAVRIRPDSNKPASNLRPDRCRTRSRGFAHPHASG